MDKTLGVKLSTTQYNQVKRYATEHDLTMSQTVRRALKELIPEPVAPAPPIVPVKPKIQSEPIRAWSDDDDEPIKPKAHVEPIRPWDDDED